MPPLVLETFSTGQKNYVQQLNNNNTAIMAAVNALQAQVLASIGEGSDLILDLVDRPGFVGSASYQLDLENYAGGSTMDIGRRPVANPILGEVDESVVWGTFAGEKARVKKVGDTTLNFGAVVSGLPKTVYVVVGSGGVPQIVESDAIANVVYLYSMTYTGFGIDPDTIKRMAPIHAGYSLIQDMAGVVQQMRQLDTVTDWLADLESATGIVLMGSPLDNEIGVNGQVEVLGFFLHVDKQGPEGFEAFEGSAATELRLRVVTDPGEGWGSEDFIIDAQSVPDDFFVALDAGVQSKRFITEITRFYLERVSIGAGVVSAQCFTWGVIVRPLLGSPVGKDSDTVGQI